jgi:hypothetical protein
VKSPKIQTAKIISTCTTIVIDGEVKEILQDGSLMDINSARLSPILHCSTYFGFGKNLIKLD